MLTINPLLALPLPLPVHARALAEAHGMRAVTGAEEIDEIRRAVGRAGLGEAAAAAAAAEAAAAERNAAAAAAAADLEAEAEAAEAEAEADERGAYRRARLRRVSGQAALPRAVGPGWLSANPLGGHLSETEAQLALTNLNPDKNP